MKKSIPIKCFQSEGYIVKIRIVEHPRVRETTITVIQAYHAGWTTEHGACEPCWKSFRDAARILRVLKQTRPQPPVRS